MKKILLLITLLILFSCAMAKNKSDPNIPFIVNKTVILDSNGKQIQEFAGDYSDLLGYKYQMASTTNSTSARTKTEQASMKASEVTKVVQDIRDSLCDAIKNGEFRVWLKFDASGKILGIGASSEGGIEAVIKCS